MKLITTLTLTLTLFSLAVNAQLVSCPLTIPVEKDSTVEVWGLLTSNQTPWTVVGNLSPNSNAKNEYLYSEWISLDSKLNAVQEVSTVFLATQNRVNPFLGLVEMQAYYCVYNLKGRNKKEKK